MLILANKQIQEEVEFGVLPIRPKEKKFGFIDLLLVSGGFSIASWCFTQGGYLGATLHPGMIVANTLFGFGISTFFVALAGMMWSKYGVDHWLGARAQFGYLGSAVVMIIAWAIGMGWYAINCLIFGAAADKVTVALGFPAMPSYFWPVICIVIPWTIAAFGPIAIKWLNRIMVPLMVAVLLFMIYLVFSHTTIQQLSLAEPIWASIYPDARYPMALALEWNIAFGFSWLPAIGQLTRLCKGTRNSFWGLWGGLGGIPALAVIAGGIVSLYFSGITGSYSENPTDWLLTLGSSYGLLSFVFLAAANMTTNAVGIYAVTLSSKIIFPKTRSWKVSLPWVIYLLFLTLASWIWSYYALFLAFVGIITSWALAIIIADFFIIRKQKLHVRSLYYPKKSQYKYTHGFNVIAFIALIFGIIVYLSLYDPIAAYPRVDLFLYLTASLPSFFTCFFVYILLAQLKPIRRYLIKSHH